MKRRVVSTITFAVVLLVVSSFAYAGTFIARAPESFAREAGKPETFSRTFTVLDPTTTFTLVIHNGGLNHEFQRVASAVVDLNGTEIVGPRDFNQQVSIIQKPVTLQAMNTFTVELRSALGSGFALEFIGVDNVPPTITASADRPPNVVGWYNANVIVSFTCYDKTSGLASCPAPVTVSTERTHQIVTGTATDNAGNVGTTQIAINLDKTPPTLTVLTPPNGATVSAPSVTITGTATDLLSGTNAVTCQTTPAVLSGSSFTCSATLILGPNSIPVRAVDNAGNAVQTNLTIQRINTSPGQDQLVRNGTARPNGIFINEPTMVTFTAQVGIASNLIVSSVTLIEYDSSYNPIATLGRMYDDGTHGDALPGDNIFTVQFAVNQPTRTTFHFSVSALYGTSVIYSPFFTLNVVPHITDAEFAPLVTIPNQGEGQYQSYVSGGLSPLDARNKTITWLMSQPSVLQAGASESGLGIWILYRSGLLGGIQLNPANTKGGQPLAPASPVSISNLSAQSICALIASSPAALPIPVNTLPDTIGSRNAIAIGAFHDQFEPDDEPDEIATLMRAAPCPINVQEFYNAQVNVNLFKTLSNYGAVVISSHGDTWYNGLFSLWTDQFGWGIPGSQVVVYTREQATTANRTTYEIDLRMGRLAVGNGNWYVITPSFISFYDTSFPQSLIYMSSCRSLYNNSMASAFLTNGAETYFGYSDYVLANFSNSTGIQLFTDLINSGKTTGQAFTPGTHDASNPPAYFVIVGDNNLTLPTNIVGNSSFETGTFNSWVTGGAGFAAIVATYATDGTYSARLGRWDAVYSGGANGPPVGNEPFGYDFMYQDVQLPAAGPPPLLLGTITLTFDYHVLTYDAALYDWFDMFVEDPTTGSVLATVANRDGRPGGNWGDYYDVGQKSVTYDLTSLAGRKVRLWFGTRQDGYGDQTTTFIDNVRINCR